jgi:hypothetical protein
MRQSIETKELNAAVALFQAEVPKVSKGNTAEVVSQRTGGRFTYKYADLADVMNAAIPVLAKHGLSIVQGFVDGRLQTEIHHSSGQWRGDDGLPLPLNLSPQELGSAITYFRRYGACAAVGIAPEEDDDGAAAQKPHARSQVQPIKGNNLNQQLRQSVATTAHNPDAEDDLSFLNDDRHPGEVAAESPYSADTYRKAYAAPPVSQPALGAISAGQVKRLWAIAKQAGKDKDKVLQIVGSAGFESVEAIGWKAYNAIIEQIQAA